MPTAHRLPTFYVIGNAMQITAVSGIFGVTMSIGGDRWEGTLPYLFGTPANRLAMFVGRAFMHILDGMLGVMLAFGWGVLLLGLDLLADRPGARWRWSCSSRPSARPGWACCWAA